LLSEKITFPEIAKNENDPIPFDGFDFKSGFGNLESKSHTPTGIYQWTGSKSSLDPNTSLYPSDLLKPWRRSWAAGNSLWGKTYPKVQGH